MTREWWFLPLVLFVLPLVLALVVNRVYRHRRGVSQNFVLALFVTACWLTGMIVIWRQVH